MDLKPRAAFLRKKVLGWGATVQGFRPVAVMAEDPGRRAAPMWGGWARARVALARALSSPWFVFGVLTLVFFWPAITAGPGEFIAGHDVIRQDFWNRSYIASRVAEGGWPLWCPHYYFGHPFMANPINNLYYPPAVLYLLTPLPAAFTTIVLLHVWLAGVGMYYFVRRVSENAGAGWAAGVAYAFSGYMVDRIAAGHPTFFQPAALLPWLMLLVERALQSGSRRAWGGAGLLFGGLILGGVPQVSFYIALMVVCYPALKLGMVKERAGANAWKSAGLGLAALFLVAFGVAAIQVIPTVELAGMSDRAEKSFEFTAFFAYPAIAFTRFLAPGLAVDEVPDKWEFSGYAGLVTLVLAGAAFASRKRVRLVLPLGVLGALAVSVMLGEASPLFRLYFHVVPGFDLFRIHSRAMIVLVFSLCALAGMGAARLVEMRRFRRDAGMLGLAGVALAAAVWGIHAIWRDPLPVSRFVFVAFCCLTPAGALLLKKRFTADALPMAALAAVVFCDLWGQLSHSIPIHNEAAFLEVREWEEPVVSNPGLHRVAMLAGGSRSKVLGYHDVNGYEPIVHGDYMRLVYAISGVETPRYSRHMIRPEAFQKPNPVFQRVLSLRYVALAGGRVVDFGEQPRAYWVGKSIVESGFERQLARLKKGDVDLFDTVILDRQPNGGDGGGEPGGEVRTPRVEIREFHPERVVLDGAFDDGGYVVLNELYYPGWRAWVDGEEVEIVRANGVARAVRAPAGQHEIVFEYRPWSFRVGLAITVASLVLSVGWLLRGSAAVSRFRAGAGRKP